MGISSTFFYPPRFQVFRDQPLKDLLVRAIRYGEQPEVRAQLDRVIDEQLDAQRLRDLIHNRSLAHETLDPKRVQDIREQMERAEAQRLQPHYIGSFFLKAFEFLGGTVNRRETNRYEIRSATNVVTRNRPWLLEWRDSRLNSKGGVTEGEAGKGSGSSKVVLPKSSPV